MCTSALDAALQFIADNGDTLIVCDGLPQNYESAIKAKSLGGALLAKTSLTLGCDAGDYTIANSPRNRGRQLKLESQSFIAIEDTGTADHIAIINSKSKQLLLITNLYHKASLSKGAHTDISSFHEEILHFIDE
jgi:hypothetical protein